MKALILAAGRGRRLWPFTAESPKCLLDVGGMSLLERQLYNLRTAGIRQVAVVCGFGIDRVRATLKKTADQEVKLLYNPFYAVSDNLISLWVARSEMNEDFILLNGDNIFHPHSVRTLTKQRAACTVLAARKRTYLPDDMKIRLRDGHVSHIGKALACEEADAESLGMLLFRSSGVRILREALEDIVTDENAINSHFPAVIQHIINRGLPINCCFAEEFPCSDVDTPADLERVRQNAHLYTAAPLGAAQSGEVH
jgi:choline kinase